MTTQQDLRRLVEAANDSDPEVALEAIGRLWQYLEDLERRVVAVARRRGLSWARIGALVGRTRQAMWLRYRESDEPR